MGIATSVKILVLLGLGSFDGEAGPFRGDACLRGDRAGVLADDGVFAVRAGSGNPLSFAMIDS